MTRYAVSINRRAQKNLAAVPADVYERIKKALVALGDEPRPLGSKKLKGRDGFRIRIGNCRAVYEIDDAKKTVTVLDVGDRKEIYR
jgi:mRNA interferase RelE/StbE